MSAMASANRGVSPSLAERDIRTRGGGPGRLSRVWACLRARFPLVLYYTGLPALAGRIFGPALRRRGGVWHGCSLYVAERGVSLFDIADAVKNPVTISDWEIDALGRWSAQYVGKTATVVLNEAGQVVTVWSLVK